jgi:hypothetical protein
MSDDEEMFLIEAMSSREPISTHREDTPFRLKPAAIV